MIIANGLNTIKKKSKRKNKKDLIEGLQASKNLTVINLQYVDDTILFGKTSITQAMMVKLMLSNFVRIEG